MTAVQLFAVVMFLRCSEKKDAEERSLDERMIREVNMRRLLASVSLTGLGLSPAVSVTQCVYMPLRKSNYWPEHVIPRSDRWRCAHFN